MRASERHSRRFAGVEEREQGRDTKAIYPYVCPRGLCEKKKLRLTIVEKYATPYGKESQLFFDDRNSNEDFWGNIDCGGNNSCILSMHKLFG